MLRDDADLSSPVSSHPCLCNSVRLRPTIKETWSPNYRNNESLFSSGESLCACVKRVSVGAQNQENLFCTALSDVNRPTVPANVSHSPESHVLVMPTLAISQYKSALSLVVTLLASFDN